MNLPKIIYALLFFAAQYFLIYWNIFEKYTIFAVILVGFAALFLLMPRFFDLKKGVRRDVLLIKDEKEDRP